MASTGGVGSDISAWTRSLIPGASLLNANDKWVLFNPHLNYQSKSYSRYFWYHHSVADTMDVLDPDNLDKATAVWAVVSYIIADLKDDFPRSRDTDSVD